MTRALRVTRTPQPMNTLNTSPSQPVRWGILGAARIAQAKVIPALQANPLCQVQVIGARDLARAQAMASSFGITSAYGSYEAVLDDPLVEAV